MSEGLETMVDEMVDEEIDLQNEDTEEEFAPSETSPEWAEFILKSLDDSELVEGNPTVDGLRRVTEKHFGVILSSETAISHISSNAVYVTHSLEIRKHSDHEIIRISGAVDATTENTPHPFNKHLTASACTKAEGKALRRALKVRLHTNEELNHTTLLDNEESTEPASDQQLAALNIQCERNNINVAALIAHTASKKVKKLKDFTTDDARVALKKISEFSRTETPEDMLGYSKDWKESFKR